MKTLTFALAFLCAVPAVPGQETGAKENTAPPAVAEQPENAALVEARKQLVVLRARHGEKHPKVQAQMRRIAELRKEANGRTTPSPVARDATPLEAAKQELAALRERYTDQHPLVKNQLRKVAELEAP